MSKIALKINDSTLVNKAELICIAQDPAKEKEFDQKYPLSIFRAQHSLLQKYTEKQLKNFNSVVSGNTKLGLKGKLSMIVVASLSIYALSSLLRRRIQVNKQYDVIILHCFSISALVLANIYKMLYFKRKIRTVFSNGFVYSHSGFRPADFVLATTLKATTMIICNNEAGMNRLDSDFSVPPSKLRVCHNWVDLSQVPRYQDVRDTSSAKNYRILSVGRIVPEKGISELIELAKYIEQNGKGDYVIDIVGDSLHPLKDELLEYARSSKVLRYHGRINKPDLWTYYKQADAFIMPVQWDEGFGNVLLEAFNFGLPVIASNRGGIPYVCKPFTNNFELLNSYHPQSILEALNALKHRQHVIKSLLAEQNRNIIKQYYSEKNASVYADVYKEICKK